MLKKLFKYAPVQLVSALSVFILIAIQTKFLGVEEYGMLAVFFLVTEVCRGLSSQWINSSMLRLYPSESQKNKQYYITASLYLLTALSIPTLGVIACSILFYDSFTWSIFTHLVVLLFSKSGYLFWLDMARLNERVNAFRLASLLQSLLSILCTFLLLNFYNSLESALLALIISYITVLPAIATKFNFTQLSQVRTYVYSICSYGLPLMISGTLASLTSRVDRLIIADTMGLIETGVYSALSNMLLGLIALVFMVVAMPLYPEMTKVVNDKEKLAELHSKYFSTLMLISLPALIGLCLIAKPMISIFLTDEYLQFGVELFYVLALSAFVLNVRAHYIDHGLQFTSNTSLLPVVIGVSIVVNICLSLLLINLYGVYGAALATLVTNLITVFISYILATSKGYRYRFSKDLIKVFVASAIMFICMILTSNVTNDFNNYIQLSLLIITGSFTYLIAHFLMNTENLRTNVYRFLFK